MRVVRDLFHLAAPIPVEMYFNTDDTGVGGSVGYKGQLCKMVDGDDLDEGRIVVPSVIATALENLVGILAEDVAAGTTWGLDGAVANPVRKKIVPICPTSVIRAEYSRFDAAGTANTDTGASGSSGSATFTPASITTADLLIGGWVYFLTGGNAGYLHHVKDNGTTTVTFSTVLANAVVSADTFLVIQPPFCNVVDFDATYSNLKSEIDDNVTADAVSGLDHYIEAIGTPASKLDKSKHDGLNFGTKAKFYHDFTIPGAAIGNNAWANGITTS